MTSRQGWIYYVGCPETMRLKIGFTSADDPRKRLSSLQTGSPTRLILLGILPGTIEDERDIHRKFSAERMRGEWFEASERMLEHFRYVDGVGCISAPGKTDRLERFGRKALAANKRPISEGSVL